MRALRVQLRGRDGAASTFSFSIAARRNRSSGRDSSRARLGARSE
jgi:hypothetical protein